MHIRLLGPLEIVPTSPDPSVPAQEARTRSAGPPKQRALLAILALAGGRAVSIERIIDAMWGEAPPASALASIHAYVSNLRRLLRSDDRVAVKRVGAGYALDLPNGSIDVSEFRDAVTGARRAAQAGAWEQVRADTETALRLWRDQALVDLLEFDELEAQARALEAERVECRELRAQALVELQAPALALPDIVLLRRDLPEREEGVRLHMIALDSLGRHAEASEIFHEHSRVVAGSTGLDPSPALTELHAEMLRGMGSTRRPALSDRRTRPLRQGEPVDARTGEDTADEAAAVHDRPELVGRDHERRRISLTVRAARQRNTRWIMLTGPAGIGKSVLADSAAHEIGNGSSGYPGRAVWIRNRAEFSTQSGWTTQQLLERIGAPAEGIASSELRDPSRASRLAHLERALRQHLVEPTVIVVDDVHWADHTSLRDLLHLLDSIADLPVLIVLTARNEGPVAAALREALGRAGNAELLPLGSLDAEEVGDLVHSVTGERMPGAEAETLLAATNGTPFLVHEFARLPREERDASAGRAGLRFVLERRLAALEPEDLAVLRVAAVIGDEIDAAMLAGLTGTQADELADALDAATDLAFVTARDDGRGYVFAHALIREHVLSSITPARRQRMELHAAEWLEDGGSRSAQALARRAAHLLLAVPFASGRRLLDACADAARAAEAEADALAAAHWWGEMLAAHLREDAAGEERDAIRRLRIEALARAGRGATAVKEIDDGLLAAVRESRTDSAGRIAATLLRLSGCWPWPTYEAKTLDLLHRLAGMETFVRDDPAAHARVLAALAVGSYYSPDAGATERLSTQALEIAERLGDPDVLADAILGRLLAFIGSVAHAEEALELLDRLRDLPHGLRRFDAALGPAARFGSLFVLGRLDEARQAHREAILEADAQRITALRVQMRWAAAMLHEWEGRFDEAEAGYELAFRLHHESELYLPEGASAAALFTLRFLQGRWEELAPFAEIQGDLGSWGRALDATRCGRREEARTMIDGFISRATPMRWPTLATLTFAAHLVTELELRSQAAELVAILSPYRHAIAAAGQVGAFGSVAAALAKLHRLLGDPAAAEACERIDGELRAG